MNGLSQFNSVGPSTQAPPGWSAGIVSGVANRTPTMALLFIQNLTPWTALASYAAGAPASASFSETRMNAPLLVNPDPVMRAAYRLVPLPSAISVGLKSPIGDRLELVPSLTTDQRP